MQERLLGNLKEAIRDGARLSPPANLPASAAALVEIMQQCWQISPEARPSAEYILLQISDAPSVEIEPPAHQPEPPLQLDIAPSPRVSLQLNRREPPRTSFPKLLALSFGTRFAKTERGT